MDRDWQPFPETAGPRRVGRRRLPRPRSGVPAAVPAVVGSIFRNARRAQKLSQAEVAALTRGRPGQISRAMVSMIERGRHLPGLEATVALSRALHVEPMEIFEQVDLSRAEPPDLAGHDLEELGTRAQQSFWAGDFRGALATCDRMLELLDAGPLGDRERRHEAARIEIHRAAALRHCGALTASRTAAERAVALAEDAPDLQARAYIVLASLLERRGNRPLARDMAARAIELADGHGPKLQGLAWIEFGTILFAWDRHEEARAAFLKAGAFVREAGDHRHEIHVEGNVGSCYVGLGRGDRARRCFIRAIELARRYEIPASEAFWMVELGKLSLEGDHLDEADRLGEAALRIAKPCGDLLTVFRAECLRHRVVRQSGRIGGDGQRLARLHRMYAGVREHAGVEEVRWFEREIIGRGPGRRAPSGGKP